MTITQHYKCEKSNFAVKSCQIPHTSQSTESNKHSCALTAAPACAAAAAHWGCPVVLRCVDGIEFLLPLCVDSLFNTKQLCHGNTCSADHFTASLQFCTPFHLGLPDPISEVL